MTALPSCTVPIASVPTKRNIQISESSAEPLVPNTYRREVTLLGRPSRSEMRPTKNVKNTLKQNMMAAAPSPK